jgi:hypothetical protein
MDSFFPRPLSPSPGTQAACGRANGFDGLLDPLGVGVPSEARNDAIVRLSWTKLADGLKGLNDTRVRLAHHSSFPFEGEDVPPRLRANELDR